MKTEKEVRDLLNKWDDAYQKVENPSTAVTTLDRDFTGALHWVLGD